MVTLIVLPVLKEGYDPEALLHQLETCQARRLKAVWLYLVPQHHQMLFTP